MILPFAQTWRKHHFVSAAGCSKRREVHNFCFNQTAAIACWASLGPTYGLYRYFQDERWVGLWAGVRRSCHEALVRLKRVREDVRVRTV